MITETVTIVTEQKDENGIAIVTGPYETWAFLDTERKPGFFAIFRRFVIVNNVRYAEVDYAHSRNGPRKLRWCELTNFTALEKCQPGDDLLCLWILGKPYVFAIKGCERGHPLTEKEWNNLCNSRYFFPELYNQLVEA